MNSPNPKPGIAAELRLMARRGREVWPLIPRRHKLALTVAALVMACTSACNTALPILLGRLVDSVRAGTDQGLGRVDLFRAAFALLGLIGVAYLVREALNVLRRLLVENTCTRINRDMNVRLLAHLMRIDLNRLSKDKVGALHGKMFRSVDGLVRFLRLSFLDFFPAIITGTFALAAAVGKQPLMGIVMAGVAPLSIWLTVRQLISQKGVRLQLMRSCEEIDGMVVEQLGGMEYIRAADTLDREVDRLAAAAERRRRKEIRHHFVMSLFGCGKALNEGFFHVLVLAFAITLAIFGWVSLGDVLTFSMLFLSVMAPLNEVHRVLDEGHESSLRVGDLLEMLAEPVDRSYAVVRPRTPELDTRKAALVVKDLRVDYTAADGRRLRALHGVSMTIRHGETIGVAGRSGSGKSTWLKVLLRLVHPSGGTVLLGGVPLESVSRADLGRLLGYVGQNPFVFAGTIAENVAYGCPGATREDVRRACRLAHLHNEILELPSDYDTVLTERGTNLSGGQRQRLALARILLRQPPVLVLDEATSALDNISERCVQRALGLTSGERTTVLVAHRLSTLRDADRIFVFDDGRVAEVGTYDELVHAGGVFTELVNSAEQGLLSPESPKPDEEEVEEPVAQPA